MSKSAVDRPVDQQGKTTAGTLRRQGRHIMANWIRELALLPVIVLLVVIGAFVNPSFLTATNFINVAQESAALGAVVVAETLILLTGKFDLSLQATYGLAPMVGAWLIVSKDGQGLGTNWNPFIGIAIVLLVGLIVGAFNGFMVIKLGFNAFIFTLAMLILLTRIGVFIVASLLAGLAGLMTAGQVVAVTAGQGNNLIFSVFAAAVIGGISLEGGRGRMVGALTGVILLALVQNILILSQIQTFWIDAATGLIILIALGLARLIGTERA